MRAALLIAVAAGCSFDAPLTTDPEVDAPIPDGDPGNPDDDGDGVLDVDDNCVAIQNPQQFDEDSDDEGDECDLCPQVPGPHVDGDGDLIGDACDPNPNTPGDALVFWNGFHVPQAGLPAGLEMVHGSAARWAIADGHLVFTRSNDDWGIPVFDTGARHHSVDTRFEITQSFQPPAFSASAAGVTVDVADDDADLYECQARTDVESRELWYWNGRLFGGWSGLAQIGISTPEDTYRFVFHRRSGALECQTQRETMTTMVTSSDGPLQLTRAGLFARNVDVRFQYLAVYTSP